VSALSIATAKEVFDLLRDDLAAIEEEFTRQSASEVDVITDIAQYLMAGGGKRIRPLLLLLSSKGAGLHQPLAHPSGRGGGDAAHRDAGA